MTFVDPIFVLTFFFIVVFIFGLIALFPLSFANCAILHLIFCKLCFVQSSLKEGKKGKRWGAKSLKKNRGCKIIQLAKR